MTMGFVLSLIGSYLAVGVIHDLLVVFLSITQRTAFAGWGNGYFEQSSFLSIILWPVSIFISIDELTARRIDKN